jgi:predicted metalloprotease with PDZ domain
MGEHDKPQPAADQRPIAAPQDIAYPGLIRLAVDATDVERCIFRVRETIPVPGAGPMTLLFPKWLPGYHSPVAPIELLAGLDIRAGGARLAWRRDPVEVYAFHVDVPEGVEIIEASFQFLSPTSDAQGTVAMTDAMLALRWNTVVLYPAGYFSRGVQVEASVTLPEGWAWACALEDAATDGATTTFAPIALDVLVDSPLLAGRWSRQVDLDDSATVRLNLFADRPELLEFTPEQVAPHRSLVAQADKLFGGRHFDHFDFLAAVSEQLGGGGVEHQRSCEIVVPADYFAKWEPNTPKRDVFAHEYVHSWNGKFRRGEDSWTPSFERPIRNSLMWVYEGQTQYWGEVLAARSGLWTPQQALDTVARTAALYDNRPGGRWRPMSDTTRDPIIASREPLPWPSWQRSEDYYAEGKLLWLDVDTLLRELSDDARSLDDFAHRFFGRAEGRPTTWTYRFEDVVAALDEVAPHDWTTFLTERLESRETGAPLDGLKRGGYRLVYRDTPSDFAVRTDAETGVLNLRFSVGLTLSSEGVLQEVIWESPAFEAGLVAAAKVLAVNGYTYAPEVMTQAIVEAKESGAVNLLVQRGGRCREVAVRYAGGHRYPHLEAIAGARPRLDEILAPKA